jgi:hypothetical protein
MKNILYCCSLLLSLVMYLSLPIQVEAGERTAALPEAMMAQECEKPAGGVNAHLPEKPSILSRREWNALEPRGEMKKLEPHYITIHHTASNQKKETPLQEKMRDLQRFSREEAQLSTGKLKVAWPDIPYHYYIDFSGRIAEGREMQYIGDTNTDYDPAGHILVVLEGNFELENPTAGQLESLYKLTARLAAEWHIQPSNIKGHKDYTETQCPGKNLEPEIEKLQEYIRALPSTGK